MSDEQQTTQPAENTELTSRSIPDNDNLQNREDPRMNPHFRAAMWKPGQSGNPGGRPKKLTRHLDKLLDEPYNGKDTYAQALVKSALKRAITRSYADANMIWERAEGKVPQALTGPDGSSPFNVAIVFGSAENVAETQDDNSIDATIIENKEDTG